MRKPRLVGVVHLPPLPGSPRAALPCAEIARLAARDCRALEMAGFDLVMIENYGDAPFFPGRVPAVTVAAMTACVVAAREACPQTRLGVNVLRNDAEAALSIAAVVGAACVRVNVHTGARVTDQGVVEGRAAESLRLRAALGARVEVWADVDVKHSAPLSRRDVGLEADDAVHRGLADAVLVTGEGTGRGVDRATLERVRGAVPGTPLLVASGATLGTLEALAPWCDGVVVGSALREGDRAGGPVDADRARRFAEGFRRAFAAQAD